MFQPFEWFHIIDFTGSKNPGFFVQDTKLHLRMNDQTDIFEFNAKGELPSSVDSNTALLFKTLIQDHSYLFGPVGE